MYESPSRKRFSRIVTVIGFGTVFGAWVVSFPSIRDEPQLYPMAAFAAWAASGLLKLSQRIGGPAFLLLAAAFTILANLGTTRLLVGAPLFQYLEGLAFLIAIASCAAAFAALPRLPARDRPGFAMLLASVLLASVLALASGEAGGPDGMVEWLRKTLGWSLEAAELSTVVFRKIVHFTFFGILAWMAFRAALAMGTAVPRAVVFALLWSATFAAFDEISQLASPARTGSAIDFVLDMLGAGTFVWLSFRRNRTQNTHDPLQPA